MADLMLDWAWLPSPATVRIIFAATNQTGNTVYVRTRHRGPNDTGLPAGWTDTTKNYGALAHGETLYNYHESTRTTPAFSAGEATENTELRIEFFSDSGYTTLVTTLVEPLNWTHYRSNDSAFTLVDEDDFEVSSEGWTESNHPTNTWAGGDALRGAGQGYASTYAMYSSGYGQTANSLRMVLGDGSLPVGQDYSLETRLWVNVYGLNISNVWHVLAGKHSLSGSNVGVALLVSTWDVYAALSKKFSRPTTASKLYVSLLARFNSYWYIDKVRWVRK